MSADMRANPRNTFDELHYVEGVASNFITA